MYSYIKTPFSVNPITSNVAHIPHPVSTSSRVSVHSLGIENNRKDLPVKNSKWPVISFCHIDCKMYHNEKMQREDKSYYSLPKTIL